MIKEILACEGIECVLRNDQLSAAVGEIPFIECQPELWVIDDEAFPRAASFLQAWLNCQPASVEEWICPSCAERCDGRLGACWACGTLRESLG